MEVPNRLRREDGAAAVEFALIVGVLAMLLFGMLQFGLAFFQLQNLRSAAREGARIGAVGAIEEDIRERVEKASTGAIPAGTAAMVVTTCPSDPSDTDESVVMIDLSSGELPDGLQEIFSVDIPFVPPIVIDSEVSGEFRCER